MSHSVPSDISTMDPAFVVGPDLVEFNRHDLPIYASPDSLWAEAGLDVPFHGAALDRLFGETSAVFVDATPGSVDGTTTLAATILPGEDSLVVLGGLSDGLILPGSESATWAGALDDGHARAIAPGPLHAPEIVALFDPGLDGFTAVHLHDGGAWDTPSGAWSFDYTT